MLQCTKGSCGATVLKYCLPCYCDGLKNSPKDNSAWWLKHTRTVCSPYVDIINPRGNVLNVLISMVILVLNKALSFTIGLLVRVQRHWTRSTEVRAVPAGGLTTGVGVYRV